MDPPYLITDAVYNESGKWCEQNEYEIIRLMNFFIENNKPFVLEIVENYATLCPNCHRKIHLAEDAERKHLINMLYSERKDDLSKHGLNVTLEQLYSYYKIDK